MEQIEIMQDALVREFDQRFEREPEVPEVVPVDASEDEYVSEGYSPGDLEDGKIYVNTDLVQDQRIDDIAEIWANQVCEQALEEVFRRRTSLLAEKIGVQKESLPAAIFQPLIDSPAAFSWKENLMAYDSDDMDDPVPGDWPYPASTEMKRRLEHEAGHAVQLENESFEELLDEAFENVDGQSELSETAEVAGIEALPRFNEDPEGRNGNRYVSTSVGDKWSLPALLGGDYKAGQSYIDGGSGWKRGDHLYSGPYAMAEVIAYTVKHHFQRQNHIDDEINQTQKALFDLAASAEQWEDMMEGIWSAWGVPNYHELFKSHYDGLQESSSYSEEVIDSLENDLSDIEPGESDIELFYDAKSFVHAYRESGRQEPRELNIVENMAEILAKDRDLNLDGAKKLT